MNKLTQKQRRTIGFYKEFHESKRRWPTLEEYAESEEITKSSARQRAVACVRKGYMKQEKFFGSYSISDMGEEVIQMIREENRRKRCSENNH